jgi:hypothetical protein
MKDLERALGLSYPTIRSRLEEALQAAGLDRPDAQIAAEADLSARRQEILDQLQQKEISPSEAVERLKQLRPRR